VEEEGEKKSHSQNKKGEWESVGMKKRSGVLVGWGTPWNGRTDGPGTREFSRESRQRRKKNDVEEASEKERRDREVDYQKKKKNSLLSRDYDDLNGRARTLLWRCPIVTVC